MISRQSTEEWNDGTIYRVHVRHTEQSNRIVAKLDIGHSELVGKVFIGVESFVLDKDLNDPPGDAPLTTFSEQVEIKINNWAKQTYLKMRSVNLPPDVDYETTAGRNTNYFARLPLRHEYLHKETNQPHPMNPRVVGEYNLNKDGILTEMTNNPGAISNGQIVIELVQGDGQPWSYTANAIRMLEFTLVIYKPRNSYN